MQKPSEVNPSQSFSFSKRLKSFVYAWRGILCLIKTQHNAWIHLLATLVLITFMYSLQVSKIESCILLLCCALVWVCEAMNTSLEFLANECSSDYSPLIEKAKDVAAGAVLIAAVFSVVIAVMIFKVYI